MSRELKEKVMQSQAAVDDIEAMYDMAIKMLAGAFTMLNGILIITLLDIWGWL